MATGDAAGRFRSLLAMLPWLAERGTVSVAETARHFGMKEPEVVSLLERAACCGVPPYTPDQLVDLIVDDGMIEARPGQSLSRPLRLSAAEGFALASAMRALATISRPEETSALLGALSKLEAALGVHGADVLSPKEPEYLQQAREALDEGEAIAISYRSAARDEVTERVVEPYAVYSREGHWYLDGYCRLAGGLRHFRLDRVQSMLRTGERVTRPEASPGTGELVPGEDAILVVLDAPAEAAWVQDSYPSVRCEHTPEGRLRLNLAVSGAAWLERLLLRLGPDARVLQPAELSNLGAEAARRTLSRYRSET